MARKMMRIFCIKTNSRLFQTAAFFSHVIASCSYLITYSIYFFKRYFSTFKKKLSHELTESRNMTQLFNIYSNQSKRQGKYRSFANMC